MRSKSGRKPQHAAPTKGELIIKQIKSTDVVAESSRAAAGVALSAVLAFGMAPITPAIAHADERDGSTTSQPESDDSAKAGSDNTSTATESAGSSAEAGGKTTDAEDATDSSDQQSSSNDVEQDQSTGSDDAYETQETEESAAPQDVSAEADRADLWAEGVDDPNLVDELYPQNGGISLYSRSVTSVSPMSFSSEMLYFCKYESSANYDQGLSSGDGYHAMGYFQFDNRYGLGNFLKAVYNYNPSRYSCLKIIGDRYGWDVSGATRSNGSFTQLGNDLNTAWHAAYKANPSEFSQLQNGWAYSEYYDASDGVRKALKAMGINIDDRPDCIKGLVWGMTNLFGKGGGAAYIKQGEYYGANWFYKNSGIKDSMTDVEFVTTLCNYVVNNVAKRYPNQSQYWKGWQNRYKNELKDCLGYLDNGSWKEVNGKKYWYDSAGNMAKGWKSIGGETYYFGSDGAAVKWEQWIDGVFYYFNEDCTMYNDGWLTWNSDGSKSYFGSDGAAVSGWRTDNGKTYYLSPKTFKSVKWEQTIGGKFYYFDENYRMVTGWVTWNADGSKSYFGSNGAAVTGTQIIDGVRYRFDSNYRLVGRA